MSLAITGDVLAVFSAAVLTFGTCAQALSNLAEFKSLNQAVGETIRKMYRRPPEDSSTQGEPATPGLASPGGLSPSVIVLIWLNLVLLFWVTKAAVRIRAGGGEQGAQLAKFLRLAEVWGILTIGSGLALAAAVIQ